jgi:putative transposase
MIAVPRRTRRTGHLWENRFYSCPLDQAHLWSAARYVERNPVRAGMVEECEDYRWSSARAHCFGAPDALLSPNRPFVENPRGWIDWIRAEPEDLELERLRAGTRAGRPVGDEAFVRLLEARFGRSLAPARKLRTANIESESA